MFSFNRPNPSQILLLTRAMEELEAETVARDEEKVRYLGEKLPPLQVSGIPLEDLQVSDRHSKATIRAGSGES